ncbi:MAG: hypothetical protein JU82_10965 [Sulfuricurvum sp. MLSB]|jgi:hypothetical protein|uniref:hypothetical protein n=1 Tax=unclassified Sulfuricurvum TaxID=2632390 RepID=UPI00050666B6|nr:MULTISPECIES: hypothetical protein [unclassified Sulfuricurvum]KFN38638.1 MAG: hypothetical protein JU82_10965 [Sulfuricurvum sp. MLSB]
MSDVRLIDAPLEVAFDNVAVDTQGFEREYSRMSESEDDAIGQWLRNAKAKGETSESDPVAIHLLVELYRKMDRLENLILNTAPQRIDLTQSGAIGRIGFEHFELLEPLLVTGENYYGRLELPVHPKRDTALYFEALSPVLAKIIRIHPRDESEWGSYMMARERAMIRHLKGHE